LTATQNPLSSDDDDLPEIDELLSSIQQKSILASADPNDDNDDDGFIDIDELLSGMQPENVPGSLDLNSASIAEIAENRIRGGTPTDSSYSMAGSSRGEYTAFFPL